MGKKLKKIPILKIGVKNLNGRIYDKDSVNKIIDEFNKYRSEYGYFLGQIGHPEEFLTTLHNVSHDVTGLEIDGDILYGYVKSLDIEINQRNIDFAMESLENGSSVLAPRVTGIVNKDGIVEIEELFAFDIIPKSESSFKEW